LRICGSLYRGRRRHKSHDDRGAADVGPFPGDLALHIERDAVGGGIYLEAYFTEYKRNINIVGIIRDFKPDADVRNLKTAIEFKFTTSRAEVSRAIGRIFENISGYAGSLDWTRFYTVVYQTEPFEPEERIKSELTRAGTVTWKAILGSGPTKWIHSRSVW
jgi:hypothetical protein